MKRFLTTLLAAVAIPLSASAIDTVPAHVMSILPASIDLKMQVGALAYAATKRPEWAIAEMEKAIACEPRFTLAYRWLASVHDQRGELARAGFWVEALAKSGAVPPKDAEIGRAHV